MEELTQQKCVACRADAPRVTDDELPGLIKQIPDWQPISVNSVLQLTREFSFDDYVSSLSFTNAVANLAEEEDHHPLIHINYKEVVIILFTHKINGLHENDFILASKCDLILKSLI